MKKSLPHHWLGLGLGVSALVTTLKFTATAAGDEIEREKIH